MTAAFIGGGFAGLLTAARLTEAGVTCRIIEKGGGFGGTWYWNRYPGAQCDTASMVYMPLLEETGHMPSEKYAHGPEILAHCEFIGKKFGLDELTSVPHRGDRAGLGRGPVAAGWSAPAAGTSSPRSSSGWGLGPLHVPKLPGIPGIEAFRGHSFHTSRWDYSYTGGDPSGALMDKLADKRVALIGTGATSVQCVPHLSRALRRAVRVPADAVLGGRPGQPAHRPGVVRVDRHAGLAAALAGELRGQPDPRFGPEDLVQDGWTDISRRVRDKIIALPPEDLTVDGMMAAYEESDYEKMSEIRTRVDAIVSDPDTAAALKAWYRQLCKRPCFHDEYLQSFNHPNTHLVDTDGKGVQEITATGVTAAGRHYEVDCIIYASGFEVGTDWTRRAGFETVGRDGVTLSEHWAGGMRTLHGVHVHGFPNMFVVQPFQGANLISNVPHNLSEAARTIGIRCGRALDRGFCAVEAGPDAEEAWMELLRSGRGGSSGRRTARRVTTTTRARIRASSSATATPTAPAPTSPTSTSGARPAPSTAWSSGNARHILTADPHAPA